MNLAAGIVPEREAAAPPEPVPASGAWPPEAGEYFLFPGNRGCHVAVSTLASASLADEVARLAPKGLCIVGKTETENIGIDKLIRNTITNPAIHCLILAGRESEGHRSGATLLSLCGRGVDGRMRVVGSPGRRPVLKNVTCRDVEAFRNQVRLVDMIGCDDAQVVARRIRALARETHMPCGVNESARFVKPLRPAPVERVEAVEPSGVKLDKAGYFVILPVPGKGIISVEHYAGDNRLLRIIEGRDARSLYSTIIGNGWVSQLSHAAYLGKELQRAELSMKLGFKYLQDGI